MTYEVVYYEPTNERWEFDSRYDTRDEAEAKSREIRESRGFQSRVMDVDEPGLGLGPEEEQ